MCIRDRTSVPNVAKAVLIVRYVGMEEAKEPLKGRTSNINIHMKEAVGMLDDVVVIGYGTQKRGNLTGSIASVSVMCIRDSPFNNGDLKVDLPLGENLQTFIVANADHLVDTDSLSKVVVYQDAHIQKQPRCV